MIIKSSPAVHAYMAQISCRFWHILDLARLKHLFQFKGLTDSAWIWKHLCVCKDLVQHILRKRAAHPTMLGQHLAQGVMPFQWN